MTQREDAGSFFWGGLQILGYSAGLITAVRFGFRMFGSGDWTAATTDIYRSSMYLFHDYSYVPIVNEIGLEVTDKFKDFLTIYIIGCAAQFHYLNLLSGRVVPILGISDQTPMILYMRTRHKLAFVFLWPFIIIADLPLIFRQRPLLSWLVNYRPRRTPKSVSDEFQSSPYVLTTFLRGFVLVLLVILVFVATEGR